MDVVLTQAINQLAGQSPELDEVMILITRFGIFALVLAVALLWWAPTFRSEIRNACAVAGLSFLASLAFNQILLLFLHRIRPYDAGVSHLLIAANPDWSFPSDHATAAAAIAAAFWFRRLATLTSFFWIAAAILGFSRIYVGVHYLSDVLGGFVVGAGTAFVVARLYRDESWYARFLTNLL